MKSAFIRSSAGILVVALLGVGSLASVAWADQHRLHEALRSLLEAREALVADGDSYGGHREKAMKSLEDTIDEVRKSIAHEDREDRPSKRHK